MKFLNLSLVALLFISCSSNKKIAFSAIEPAKTVQTAKIKSVTFDEFENDNVGVGSLIEGNLSAHSIDGTKPYFKVVERRNLKNILLEQALSASWQVNPEDRIRVGKLSGVQGIINGKILSASTSNNSYTSGRVRCISQDSKGSCLQYQNYTVNCNTRTFNLSVMIKLVDTSTGDFTFANTFSNDANYSMCSDSGSIPSTAAVMQELSRNIASEFISSIAPTKYVLTVKLIEAPDDMDDATSEQEKLFNSGIEFAKADRIDKAMELFKKLGESSGWKSYVVNYNYAVFLEATGDLNGAEKHYKAADEIATKPIDEINEGVQRIAERIEKNRKFEEQMKDRGEN